MPNIPDQMEKDMDKLKAFFSNKWTYYGALAVGVVVAYLLLAKFWWVTLPVALAFILYVEWDKIKGVFSLPGGLGTDV
jgi:hypothetical protein